MWLVPDALFLIVVLVANTGIIIAFIVTTVDVSEAEANIALERLYFSPTGFSERDDDLQRVYSGKIDSANFDTTKTEDVLNYKNTVMSARLRAIEEETVKKDAYLKKKKYDTWAVFAVISDDVGGRGIEHYPVLKQVSYDNKPVKIEQVVLMPR
ncbi:hypothetical protein CMO88_03500 [Candidatus Woesearchaeota archaeon]|nr:hypothetical protein [Candidatus Woesearchaeota archaeon]